LLKTLEEPPDHAKFIFATTEIRKVPITVLSRCQRFDLRRVEARDLQLHLKAICGKENVKVSDDGLALIARAAEGSVRDSLSLLDQAIVQSGLDGTEVSGEQVRNMLGLAGDDGILDLAPDQIIRVQALAAKLTLGELTRIWQMLLKAYNDVRLAPVPLAAAEMALLKIAVAGAMPPPELVAKLISEIRTQDAAGGSPHEGGAGNFSAPQISPQSAAK